MNKCITQLHRSGWRVQMFKQDNRKYPDMLATPVQKDASNNIIPFTQAGTNTSKVSGLYPRVREVGKIFHCPDSKFIDDRAVGHYNLDPQTPVDAYAYDSDDFMDHGPAGSSFRQHYTKKWADDPATHGNIPNDTKNPPVTGDPTLDYERQLLFRTPPATTVVTWCSNHESFSGTGDTMTFSGKTPVLYVDGHVDNHDAVDMEVYRYRMLPKKE